MNKTDRPIFFVDRTYLQESAQQLGFNVDLRRLLDAIGGRGVLRTYYYSAASQSTSDIVTHLCDWLATNRIFVQLAATGEDGERALVDDHGSDVLKLAFQTRRAFICSNRPEIADILRFLRHQRIHVTLVLASATINADLQRCADQVVELESLRSRIEHRVVRPIAAQAQKLASYRQ